MKTYFKLFSSAALIFLAILGLSVSAVNVSQGGFGDPSKSEGVKICTMDYSPVCGSDGKTYSNQCSAENSGVKTFVKGECTQKKDAKSDTKKQQVKKLSLKQKKSIDKFLSGLYLTMDKKYEYSTDKVEFLNKLLSKVENKLLELSDSQDSKVIKVKLVLEYLKKSITDKLQTLDLRI